MLVCDMYSIKMLQTFIETLDFSKTFHSAVFNLKIFLILRYVHQKILLSVYCETLNQLNTSSEWLFLVDES